MYGIGRRISTLLLTCLFVVTILDCLSWQTFQTGIFTPAINELIESAAYLVELIRNGTEAFQNIEIRSIEIPANIIAFFTNTWFIAFLFVLTTFFPWFMRFIDWHFTPEETKEKRRHKIFVDINWEYRYCDRNNRPKFEDLRSFRGPDLMVGIVLAVIFFVISIVFSELKNELNFLIAIFAYVPCFFAVFKSHERWTNFPKVEKTGAPPIPGYEDGGSCAYGGCL